MEGRAGHLEIPTRLRRGPAREERASIEDATALIGVLCHRLGLDDLGDSDVLDVGCGVKFTQAILSAGLPVRRYVGVEVDREIVDFLRHHVDDDRFEFVHADLHNERYNPSGSVLTPDTDLGLAGRQFDVVCLFSVFTHLAPHDFRSMLCVLRRHARPSGRLLFTLYLDELTEGGHGLMDSWCAKFAAVLPPEQLEETMRRTPAGSTGAAASTFVDLDPKQPLRWAVYSEAYARALIAGTGWEVLGLFPPGEHLQHHFVCAAS